jgi:hypothetical protein
LTQKIPDLLGSDWFSIICIPAGEQTNDDGDFAQLGDKGVQCPDATGAKAFHEGLTTRFVVNPDFTMKMLEGCRQMEVFAQDGEQEQYVALRVGQVGINFKDV